MSVRNRLKELKEFMNLFHCLLAQRWYAMRMRALDRMNLYRRTSLCVRSSKQSNEMRVPFGELPTDWLADNPECLWRCADIVTNPLMDFECMHVCIAGSESNPLMDFRICYAGFRCETLG